MSAIPSQNPNPRLDDIRALAREIEHAAPRLGTGHNLSPYLRHECERLANTCGLPNPAHAHDNDLISVYLVAKRDPMAATRVAERVALRLDPTFFPAPHADPVYARYAPFPPLPPREPEPTWMRAIPKADPAPDLNALRALIKDEVREGALEPLQRALETLQAEHAADMSRVGEEAASTALEAVREAIAKEAHAAAAAALQAMQPVRLDVYTPAATEPRALGLVHRKTPLIINALSAGVNVYLHGPAGSGKTTVARKCADAFGLPFHFAAKVESEYQLTGFKDAKGDTVRTPFREAYEHGGVFLFDEMDASSPSAVVAMNAALANGICPFPDGTVTRHADFYCIGAGNTKLTGATRQYAGRNQLDAASIDRFSFIEFGYDNDLELALATDATWARYVQAVRAAVAERGLNHLVTPRATYDGCKLLAAGFDWKTVAGMVVYKGLEPDTVRQIEAALDYSK